MGRSNEEKEENQRWASGLPLSIWESLFWTSIKQQSCVYILWTDDSLSGVINNGMSAKYIVNNFTEIYFWASKVFTAIFF